MAALPAKTPVVIEIAARGIVIGKASGPALVSAEAVSFLGDVDIRSGRVVGDLASVRNASLRGTVLIMPYTRGSAGAWRSSTRCGSRRLSSAIDAGSLSRSMRAMTAACAKVACIIDRSPCRAVT